MFYYQQLVWKRHVYPNVHCSTVYNSQDMEAAQMSISRWMDKKAVVHIHNGVFSSVQFSRSVVSDSLRPHESQHARPPCVSPTPGVHSDSRPSSHWCHQPSHPLLSPTPPAPNPSQHQSLFQWVNSSHEVAKVLEFQPQHRAFQWTPRTDLL